MVMTRAQVRDAARVIADISAEVATDALLNSWFPLACRDLHEHLISAFGPNAFVKHAWINVENTGATAADEWPGVLPRLWPQSDRQSEQTGAPSSYRLPSDFSRATALQWSTGRMQQGATAYAATDHLGGPYTGSAVPGGTYMSSTVDTEHMRPVERLDLANDRLDLSRRTWSDGEVAYGIRWDRVDTPTLSGVAPGAYAYATAPAQYGWVLDLYPPVPDGSQYVVRLDYVPTEIVVQNDTDSVAYEQWSDWLTYDLACRIQEMQGRPSAVERRTLDGIKARIALQSAPVDRARPRLMGGRDPFAVRRRVGIYR